MVCEKTQSISITTYFQGNKLIISYNITGTETRAYILSFYTNDKIYERLGLPGRPYGSGVNGYLNETSSRTIEIDLSSTTLPFGLVYGKNEIMLGAAESLTCILDKSYEKLSNVKTVYISCKNPSVSISMS